MNFKLYLQKIIVIGLLLTLIIFPITTNIALISPTDLGHPLFAINFSLADICIGVLFLLWLFKIVIYKEYSNIFVPPAQILIFIGLAFISFVNVNSIFGWAKDAIQMTEYFICYYLLLKNNLENCSWNKIKLLIFSALTLTLIIAFFQRIVSQEDVFLVRGLFENHNILGSFLCIFLPFVYSEFIFSKSFFQKSWMGVLIILSIFVLTSWSAVLSILIGLSFMSFFIGKKVMYKFIGICILLILVFILIKPTHSFNSIQKNTSLFEQGSISNNYYKRLTMLGNVGKISVFNQAIGNNYINITINDIFNVQLPVPQNGERYKDMEDKKHVKNKYLEMQASLNMIKEYPLLGAGLGSFQDNISLYYDAFPKVNTAEPNQHNSYLLVGSTMGLAGLSAFLWILFGTLKKLWTSIKTKQKNSFHLGITGSFTALLIESFFSYILVAGLLVPFVFIIYLSDKEVKAD